MRRGLLILSMLLLASASEALKPRPVGAASRMFLEGGLLFGDETEIPHYEESFMRIFLEAGANLRPSDARGDKLGLILGLSKGPDDLRYFAGPRYSRPVDSNWRLETSAALLWSDHDSPISSDFFHLGWRWRIGLKSRERLSLFYVLERMDYEDETTPEPMGTMTASFAGIAWQADPPPLVTTAVMVTLAVYWFRASTTAWIAQAK